MHIHIQLTIIIMKHIENIKNIRIASQEDKHKQFMYLITYVKIFLKTSLRLPLCELSTYTTSLIKIKFFKHEVVLLNHMIYRAYITCSNFELIRNIHKRIQNFQRKQYKAHEIVRCELGTGYDSCSVDVTSEIANGNMTQI